MLSPTSAALLALATTAHLALALPQAGFPAQAVFAPSSPAHDQQQQLVLATGTQLSTLSHPHLPTHRLRVKHPRGLCDPGVNQTSGYIDNDLGHHHFFWQFDSRNDPSSDPVVLWCARRRLSHFLPFVLPDSSLTSAPHTGSTAVPAAPHSLDYCKNSVPAEQSRRARTRSSTLTRPSLLSLLFLCDEQTLTSALIDLPPSFLTHPISRDPARS